MTERMLAILRMMESNDLWVLDRGKYCAVVNVRTTHALVRRLRDLGLIQRVVATPNAEKFILTSAAKNFLKRVKKSMS